MNGIVARIIAALAAGVIFGFGLSISGMLNPVRVQGFLDITGAWDPSLVFVLGGAVTVAFIGMRFVKKMDHPLLDKTFHLPSNKRIDAPLIAGSALFGIGWGLGGFCPGPAIAALPVGLFRSAVFVAFMLAGMILHDRLSSRKRS